MIALKDGAGIEVASLPLHLPTTDRKRALWQSKRYLDEQFLS